MGEPPALPGDSQSLTFPEVYESLLYVNRSKLTAKEALDVQHRKIKPYEVGFKYHIVWIPKYRRKLLYGDVRRYLGEVFRELSVQKESRVVEGHLMADHVHMVVSIPPKYPVSQVVGFVKGKSAIHVARTFSGHKRNFTGQNFWARGYFVSTVGKDEQAVREYIRQQEAEDRSLDQLNLFR
jgi:putative transposase